MCFFVFVCAHRDWRPWTPMDWLIHMWNSTSCLEQARSLQPSHMHTAWLNSRSTISTSCDSLTLTYTQFNTFIAQNTQALCAHAWPAGAAVSTEAVHLKNVWWKLVDSVCASALNYSRFHFLCMYQRHGALICSKEDRLRQEQPEASCLLSSGFYSSPSSRALVQISATISLSIATWPTLTLEYQHSVECRMGGRDGKERETDEGGQQQVVVMETAQIVTRLTSTEKRMYIQEGKRKREASRLTYASMRQSGKYRPRGLYRHLWAFKRCASRRWWTCMRTSTPQTYRHACKYVGVQAFKELSFALLHASWFHLHPHVI